MRAVHVEEAVEVGDVPHAEPRLAHFRRPEVAIATEDARVVLDVPRRLLEVRHQAAPLEDLREQVRRLLTREVHAAELGDGVVAVLEEHALVELFRAAQPDRRVDGEVAGEVEIADELVEEQPAQALVGTGVPREQRALHDLGQIDEREDGPVEVREIRPERGRFVVGELLRRVQHGRLMVPVKFGVGADRTSGR